MSAALPLGYLPPRFGEVAATDLDPQPRQITDRGPNLGVPVNAGVFANPFDTPGLSAAQRLGALVTYAVWLAGRSHELAAVHERLGGRDLACTCPLGDPACHRSVLLDLANPWSHDIVAGRAAAITVRRPWASLLLVPREIGGKNVENQLWSTDYRGPVLIRGSSSRERVDEAGMAAARRAGFDADWHAGQKGWLGAAVLTDVHRAKGDCCQPWGHRPRVADRPIYHWAFDHPARLAARTWGQGFPGMRSASWATLVNRSALKGQRSPTALPGPC